MYQMLNFMLYLLPLFVTCAVKLRHVSFYSIDKQTDTTEIIYHAASQVVKRLCDIRWVALTIAPSRKVFKQSAIKTRLVCPISVLFLEA